MKKGHFLSIVLFFLTLAFFIYSFPPSPKEILGFKPGDDFKLAGWEKIEAHFKVLEKSSPKVKLEYLGKSTLGRPFFMVLISSEKNLRDIENIKKINKVLHSGKPMTKASLDELVKKGKAVVAITCTIHSTEVGAALMSTELAYRR